MATVYKSKKSKFWQISYFDHTGERRFKSSKTTDKRAAQRIANKYESDAALRRDGVIDTRVEDAIAQRSQPISVILQKYLNSKQIEENTPAHIETIQTHVAAIFKELGWETIGDVNADGMTDFLLSQQVAKKSARTRGAYIQSIRGLVRWAVKKKILALDPLA